MSRYYKVIVYRSYCMDAEYALKSSSQRKNIAILISHDFFSKSRFRFTNNNRDHTSVVTTIVYLNTFFSLKLSALLKTLSTSSGLVKKYYVTIKQISMALGTFGIIWYPLPVRPSTRIDFTARGFSHSANALWNCFLRQSLIAHH